MWIGTVFSNIMLPQEFKCSIQMELLTKNIQASCLLFFRMPQGLSKASVMLVDSLFMHNDIVTAAGPVWKRGWSSAGHVKVTATTSWVHSPKQVPGPICHVTILVDTMYLTEWCTDRHSQPSKSGWATIDRKCSEADLASSPNDHLSGQARLDMWLAGCFRGSWRVKECLQDHHPYCCR